MDLGEREILEDHTDLGIARLDGFQVLEELAAMRALEVAEFDDGDSSVRRADRWIPFDIQMRKIVGEWAGRHVVDVAAKKCLAVLADVNRFRAGLPAERNVDGNEIETRRGGRGQGSEPDFEVRTPRIQVAHKGFR